MIPPSTYPRPINLPHGASVAPLAVRLDAIGADPSRHHTDALLVAAGRGDLDAFAAFYDRTAPTVFRMLHGVLDHAARAERATEDVYLQLWRAAPSFDPTDGSAWAMVMFVARRAFIGPGPDLGTATSAGTA